MSLIVDRLLMEGRNSGTELVLYEDAKGRHIIGKLEVVTEQDSELNIIPIGYVLHDPIILAPTNSGKGSVQWRMLSFPFNASEVEVHPDELRYTYINGVTRELENEYRRATSGIEIASPGQVAKGLQMN